jgi:DNA polymerase III subunit delta
MTKNTPTFYILHGDDDFSLDAEIAKMRAAMGDPTTADLNTSEFDGHVASAAEVTAAASVFPFLADKRLILVKGMLSWLNRKGAGNTGKEGLERLAEELPTLPPTARLVFIEREKLPEKHKILKLAQEHPNGIEKAFAAPKDATGWIVKRAQGEYQTQIEPRAAAALSSVIGDDLRRADNELVKLVSYVDGKRPISEKDVELLTPYVAEASLFEMVDAIAEGKGEKAMTLLHHLLDDLDNRQDPFALYGMIIRQFRLLLTAKEYLVTGGYPGGISEALGVHKFVGEKLAKQSRAFTVAKLERVYRVLLDYDLKMKTGRIEPELALDLLIASLAQ